MRTTTDLIDLISHYFRPNADRLHLDVVFLFGSWAHGRPQEDSDLDLALVFSSEQCTDAALFERTATISLELSQKLSFSPEVNCIVIHDDFPHPMLYYNAIIHGIPVFVRTPDLLISLRNAAIFHMEDFSLFGREWQIQAAGKNMEAIHSA